MGRRSNIVSNTPNKVDPRSYLFKGRHCLRQSQAILAALLKCCASARPVYNLRPTWGPANAVRLASVQSVWLSKIRMTLGTKLGHLGVLVNLFGNRLLLRNGNLFCPLLTLNRTLKKLLLVSFKPSATLFSPSPIILPSPISAQLPRRNHPSLISNSLYCLLRTSSLLKSSLILCEPAIPARIYVLIGQMPARSGLMVSNIFWLSWIKVRIMLLLLTPKRVPIPSICLLITSLLPSVYPNSSASMALKNLSVLK